MDFSEKKKKIIQFFMNNDALISSELFPLLENENTVSKICTLIETKNDFRQIQNILFETNQTNALQEQAASTAPPIQTTQHSPTQPQNTATGAPEQISPTTPQALSSSTIPSVTDPNKSIQVVDSYELVSQKREVDHFVSYFLSRYKQIETLLKKRKELSATISIARLQAKKDREQVAIIGLIQKKDRTKNDNIILTVEDPTGEIKVLINKTNQDLLALGKDLVEDEVIGIVGTNGDNILFSNNIIQPDVPLDKEFKKQPQEEYVVFLSDIHVGSKDFLEEEFVKFLEWIQLKAGTEKQKAIARKVSYVIIAGDLVDGVGIYPGQEAELDIEDITEQYDRVAELLKQIPSHIPIIVCPGNHDAVRLSEPQPKLPENYAHALYDMPNVTLVSNPSNVTIGKTDAFPGFDVLLYHGYSFDHYAANVDSIRQEGGYDRADLIMKFLLKRRHLAPTYSSTLFIPEITHDALVIEKVPDFFITGHIHKTAVTNYRNTTLICGSCWQKTTAFQEKVGHHPEPARVPVVNLKTRNVTILNFES